MATNSTATKKSQRSQAKRPVHEIRLGRLKAAIWEQETQYGPRYNVIVVRNYQDEEGQWAQSQSFGRDDLLPLAKLLDLCHTWIIEQARTPGEVSAEETSDEEIPY